MLNGMGYTVVQHNRFGLVGERDFNFFVYFIAFNHVQEHDMNLFYFFFFAEQNKIKSTAAATKHKKFVRITFIVRCISGLS